MVSREDYRSLVRREINGSGVYGSALIGGGPPRSKDKPYVAPGNRAPPPFAQKVSVEDRIKYYMTTVSKKREKPLSEAEAKEYIAKVNAASEKRKQRKNFIQKGLYDQQVARQAAGRDTLTLKERRNLRETLADQWAIEHPSLRRKLTEADRAKLNANPQYQAARREFAAASTRLVKLRAAILKGEEMKLPE